MSYGAVCINCRCYAAHHDAEGVCRIFEMGHGGREMKAPCPCPGLETAPGDNFDPFLERVCERIEDARRRGLVT